jgi:hypothetical protein
VARFSAGRRANQSHGKRHAAAPFDMGAEAAGRAAQGATQALAHEGRLPAQAPGAGAGVGLPGGLWIASAVLAATVLALLAVS